VPPSSFILRPPLPQLGEGKEKREARYSERVGLGGGVGVCVCLSTVVLSCILIYFSFYKDKTRFACALEKEEKKK
jgi:hypothetical protein